MDHTLSRHSCPECGASAVDGLHCWEQLEMLLAWEYQDPELRAEHFLIVSCYNLQHPAQFTDAAIAGLRTMFIEYLDKHLPIGIVRQRVGQAAAGLARVRRPKAERQIVFRPWKQTIDSVYLPNQPDGAAQRVQRWGAAIRSELD